MDIFYGGGETTMERRKRRVVERPQGVGELKKGDETVATVSYSIIVKKIVIISDTFDGHSEIDGIGEIDGSLRFIEKYQKINDDEIYTLYLSDGREIDISILLANFPSKDYEFVLRNGNRFKMK